MTELAMREAIKKAKDFLSMEAGFYVYGLELEQVSDESNKWVIKFNYDYAGQKAICQVEISKETKDVAGFKRMS